MPVLRITMLIYIKLITRENFLTQSCLIVAETTGIYNASYLIPEVMHLMPRVSHMLPDFFHPGAGLGVGGL